MKAYETICPNCGAPLESEIVENSRECTYCGSVFEIDVLVSNTTICDTEKTAQKLFTIKTNKKLKKDVLETFKCLCSYLNLNYTADMYNDLFNKMAAKSNSIATQTFNKNLLLKMGSKVRLSAGEVPIFWKSSGFISKSKTGILLTNYNIHFISKANFPSISFKYVKELNIGIFGNVWIVNGSSGFGIDNIGCTDEQLGIILAFICTKARDFNLKGHKIAIT